MLTCREVTDFLDDFLDGSLPWRQRLIFRLHLLGCRDCRRYLATYRQTIAAVRAISAPDDDADASAPPFPPALVNAILAARRENAAEQSDLAAD